MWVVFSKSPPKPPEAEDAAARSERPRTATSGPAHRTRDMIATIAVADGYAAGPNPRVDVMPGTPKRILHSDPIFWSIGLAMATSAARSCVGLARPALSSVLSIGADALACSSRFRAPLLAGEELFRAPGLVGRGALLRRPKTDCVDIR